MNHGVGDPPAEDGSRCGAPQGKEQGFGASGATRGMGGDQDGAFRFHTAEVTVDCKQMMDARKQYLRQKFPGHCIQFSAEGRKRTDGQTTRLHGGNQREWLEEEIQSSLKWENWQDLRVDGGAPGWLSQQSMRHVISESRVRAPHWV